MCATASTKLEERWMDAEKKIDDKEIFSMCSNHCLLNRKLSVANGWFSLCNGDVIGKSTLKCACQL